MAGARKLEDLEAWMYARSLVRDIYAVTNTSPLKRDFGYCNQIRKAAVSIMSNIAEGFGRSSDKDFARFLDIARGSTFETQSLLYVARDISYVDPAASEELVQTSFQIIAKITALTRYLRNDATPSERPTSDLGLRTSDA